MQAKDYFSTIRDNFAATRSHTEAPDTTVVEVSSPTTIEETPIIEETSHSDTGSTGGNAYRVILYNDDWHTQDEVLLQLQKATGCSVDEAIAIIFTVEMRGRGICFKGSREQCHHVTRILREIRLQCEVDCD